MFDKVESLIELSEIIKVIGRSNLFYLNCIIDSVFGKDRIKIEVGLKEDGIILKSNYYSTVFSQEIMINIDVNEAYDLYNDFEYSIIKEAMFLKQYLRDIHFYLNGSGETYKALGVLDDLIEKESYQKKLLELRKSRNLVVGWEREFRDKKKPVVKAKPKNTISDKQHTYLMLDESTGYYKIGKSINPEYRERTLMAQKPTIKLMWHVEQNIEKQLHCKYGEYRIRGEWFNLNENQVNEIVNTR